MIIEQAARVAELSLLAENYKNEVDELNLAIRKLLEGSRREKFTSSASQLALQFPDDPDLQDSFKQAQEEAAATTEEITGKRKNRNLKKRDEKLPGHLRRELVDAIATEAQTHCAEHGERQLIRYDEVERWFTNVLSCSFA